MCARIQRANLANYLLEAAAQRRRWVIESDDFWRVFDANQEREVTTTPERYAAHMMEEGPDGHQGETPELNLFARRNQINVILLGRNTVINAIDPSAPLEENYDTIQVYRVRGNDEADVHENFEDPVNFSAYIHTVNGGNCSLQLNSIDPAYPTLFLFNSRLTYHHTIAIYDPETNTVRSELATNYSQGHYEVVRTFRIGQPNSAVPDEDSPLFITDAFAAQVERERAHELTTLSTASRVRRPEVSIDELRNTLTTVPGGNTGTRGRQKQANSFESCLFYPVYHPALLETCMF